MTDSCQLTLVICVIKTSLHEHCIKTVIKFLLVCIVYPELSGVLLRYVSFTNKEWMNELPMDRHMDGQNTELDSYQEAAYAVSYRATQPTNTHPLRITVGAITRRFLFNLLMASTSLDESSKSNICTSSNQVSNIYTTDEALRWQSQTSKKLVDSLSWSLGWDNQRIKLGEKKT